MFNEFKLSPITESGFFDFLTKQYGIVIHDHQMDVFRTAIDKTCVRYGFTAAEQLLDKVNIDSFCEERNYLIEQVTVDESYFLRDNLQIEYLKNDFFPKIIEQKRKENNKQIRIWSAGCSTGQEIYSMAIILHELLIDFDSWNLHLMGTDINHRSLNIAKKAEYSSWGIRTHSDLMNNVGYFQRLQDDCYVLNDVFKKKVTFSYLNLAEDTFPSIMQGICALDLILCRNVFIYFERNTIEKTCRKFSESLNSNGILLLSATDPMEGASKHLQSEKSNSVLYFKPKPLITNYQPQTEIKTKNRFNNTVGEIKSASTTPTLDDIKQRIIKQLAMAEWLPALDEIEKCIQLYKQDADLYQFKAKCLTNLGQMTDAKEACKRSIQIDPMDPHSYLLFGLVLIQLGLYEKAENAFRKTIFLNSSFMEAHYQLGQVLFYKNKKIEAIKSIQNAINIANKENPDRSIHNVIALTYSGFSRVMKNELELICKGMELYES